VIEREVKKLLDAKIIIPLRYSEWVANLVPVRKKNGEIRLYVDFRNLNRSSLKDNYPLPKMDHVLEKVVGANRISMIDGFSGYNHIVVHEDDREKTVFTTPWGTFMYDKIPFGLMNAGATFQRVMDIVFIGERDKFVVIYLDDLTFFLTLMQNICCTSDRPSKNAESLVCLLIPRNHIFLCKKVRFWAI
jgi:hypothetical protein